MSSITSEAIERLSTRNEIRSREEAVSYAIAKRIRIEILAILHEGAHSPSELCKLLHRPASTVNHHVAELAKSNCIEVAYIKKVRNADQHFYRAIELPFITDEEAERLAPEVKQEYAGVILQAIMAESLDALWAGKLAEPKVRMMWSWFNLDTEGREELADELRESWERITEIEGRAANRRARGGEELVSMIAATLGFERARPVSTPAPSVPRFPPEGNPD